MEQKSKSAPVKTDSKTFNVFEMNVAGLRAWWDGIATPGHSCDVVDEYAIPGISLSDLAIICHCETSDFDGLTARELADIALVAREMNPHFFRLRDSLTESCINIVNLLSDGFSAIAAGEMKGHQQ